MTVDVKTGDITNNVKGDVTGPVTPTLIDALKAAQNAKNSLYITDANTGTATSRFKSQLMRHKKLLILISKLPLHKT